MSRLLNIGCGSCLNTAFTNVDFVSTAPGVIGCDLRKGIPFADGQFDLVYHSHVLEHFDFHGAQKLLRECHRVLAPGGIIRISVPDLAQWARVYLGAFDAAVRGEPGAPERHAWMQVELLDQMVRTRSGGRFLEFLRQAGADSRPFIESRVGPFSEFVPPEEERADARKPDWKAPLRPFVRWLKSADHRRAARIRRLLGGDYPAWETALFRERGEIHQWMYDSVSLGSELRAAGFAEITVRDAVTSARGDWAAFHLDTFPDGTPRRPNSLYIEASRPSG
jgi:predicted SAM-dependent methyltransferase